MSLTTEFISGLATILTVTCLSAPAQAVPFTIPVTVVPGNANFNGNGPGLPPIGGAPSGQFTVVGNYAATDTITLNVSGTVDVAVGEAGVGYTTNAAGVTSNVANSIYGRPRSIGTVATSAEMFNPAPLDAPYGALLLSLDDFATSAVIPFAANAANGLGQVVVPTNLSFVGTLGSLFGSGIANGTVFSFRVADINTFDSAGSYTITGAIAEAVVPELNSSQAPLALACCSILLLALGGRRRPVLAQG